MDNGEPVEIQQSIDAIGAIVDKTDDHSALQVLLGKIKNYDQYEVTLWKIIRALSGFRCNEATVPLIEILETHLCPALRWEAAKSLGQIGISTPEVLKALTKAEQNDHPEVRRVAENALEIIDS